MSFDLIHFFANGMQVAGFTKKVNEKVEYETRFIAENLCLFHLCKYIYIWLTILHLWLCLRESWRMECIHENGMYEQRNVDDFIVFEYVCVIDLMVDFFVWTCMQCHIDLEKLILSPILQKGDNDEVFSQEVEFFLLWKRIVKFFLYMLDLESQLFEKVCFVSLWFIRTFVHKM